MLSPLVAHLLDEEEGGDAFLALLNSPDFWAPLTSSAILTRGVGAPTFTRATTAIVCDWENICRTALAGETRFQGARRVQNLFTNTEDFSHANWTNVSTGTVTRTGGFTDPNGGATAYRLQGGATGLPWIGQFFGAAHATFTETLSVWLRSNTGANQTVGFRNSGGAAQVTFNVTPAWQRFAATLANETSFQPTITLANNADVLAWHPQCEDVTGQSNQNPGEYVSVGVLASPFHGSMVDGVKCFEFQNGNTVAANVVTAGVGPAIAPSVVLGYLAEEARTNLCLQSADFTTTWIGGANVTVTANQATGPDGTVNADKIAEAATTAQHGVVQAFTKAASALAYTASCYAKQVERTWVYLQLDDGAGNGARAWFNLAAGVVGTVSGVGAGPFTSLSLSIQSAANGFYRCIVTATSNTATALNIGVFPTTGDTVASSVGVAGSGIYAWGSQLEQAGFATSYILTTTVAVTRNLDFLVYGSVGNALPISGTMYAEVTLPTIITPQQGIVAVNDNTANNRVDMRVNGAAKLSGFVTSGGVGQVTYSASAASIVANVTSKVSEKWSATDSNNALNGVMGVLQTMATPPGAPTQILIGLLDSGSNSLNAPIRNVRIWKAANSDAFLVRATT